MASFRDVMKSGHPPTLFAAFLYFEFCFAVWVLDGAMGPFIAETYHLTPAQTGFMISLPILAGAPMHFPPGALAQYTGSFAVGYAAFAALVLGLLFVWQRKWLGAWVGPRGKALDAPNTPVSVPVAA